MVAPVIAALAPLAIEKLGGLLDRLMSRIPDGDAESKRELEAVRLQVDLMRESAAQQTAINLAEASNPNWFVSGWRPFVGWVCSAGFAYQMVLRPLLEWLSPALGLASPGTLDTGDLMTILLGLLGMSGMRTAEKMAGKARA